MNDAVSVTIGCHVKLDPSSETRVAVFAPERAQELFPLLRAVAQANDVALVWWSELERASLAGAVVIKLPGCQEGVPQPPSSLPTFQVEVVKGSGLGTSVAFGDEPALSRVLRSQVMRVGESAPIPLDTGNGNTMAKIDGRTVWRCRYGQGFRQDINVQAEPWLFGEDRLFEHLNGSRFMRLIPLIEWFRYLSNWEQWQKPPVRACFMFDDPNLHADTYGFLSFACLAAGGRQHGYHTAFATVPLDQYYVSKSAACLFRQHPGQLSMLVHGIDHTRRELGRGELPARQIARLQRALASIERLERHVGVPVARVVAPPHGAFAAQALRNCASVGFEAACVSWGSLWSYNQSESWSRSLGAGPAAVIDGLSIIPRFRLARDTDSQIRLAAYLGQPIVPVGHHWDVADGLEVLMELRRVIGALGDVQWCNMEEISRTNYWWRQDGDTLLVRPFSRFLTIRVPADVRSVEVIAEGTSSTDSGDTPATVDLSTTFSARDGDRTLNVRPGSNRHGIDSAGYANRVPVRALARRILAESRDRLMPNVPLWLRKR